MFDSTLGMWNTTLVDLELRYDVKPLFSRPYPVLRVHEAMFKKEVEILVSLEILEHTNDSEWGAQSFDQPKAKTDHVRLLSDFWNLNRQPKRKPYPMPKKVNDIKMRKIKCAASLDLSMGYYCICLSE